MSFVRNPILPGFHPDPCIIRQGDWFYIATSTFEWWPGVQINRSRDLTNWEIAGYALTRRSQLDLRGVPDSGGVWAPALSHHDDQFWLIYSDMKSFSGPFKDVRNYLITAPDITGPWSEPVPLNGSGFDPSLFHDEDGRKWLLNQLWKPGADRSCFAGIVIQEYSTANHCLVGEPRLIFSGSDLGVTEGPHLYRKDGFYYLVTAEGGTSWEHAVTVARSRTIFGPYELSPHHPLLTSVHEPENPLQKSGHGSLVQDHQGNWYLAHLCSRPVPGTRRCVLGRETALQPVEWPSGGWPRLVGHGKTPLAQFPVNSAIASPYFARFRDDFDGSALSPHWNTLREPPSADWLTLQEQPGALRLYGRHSIQSLFDHSFVGCRVAHHGCDVRTELTYHPRSFQQRAGLTLYYNSSNFYYLFVSAENGTGFVNILSCINGQLHENAGSALPVPAGTRIMLHARLRNAELTFHCSVDRGAEYAIGGAFDATTLSDDYALEKANNWGFTGLFAGLTAQDSSTQRLPADFAWFTYESTS